ncbi:MAG TPA: hypothetical protein PLN21_10595 [Gemmatales bacterium]|nr:hypothetical protein [Gemmatales bacterium]
MTVLFQPPDKAKETPASKPAGELKQPPAKAEEKATRGKDAPVKGGQETLPSKDGVPQAEAKSPDSPIQPPPGANLPAKIQEQPKATPLLGSILQPALLLIAILAIGAILIAWLKKNRDRTKGAVTLSAHDQLSAFRDSLDEGDMTDEEFKKVKALLAEKIRKPANPVTTAPGPAIPPSPTEKPPE